MRRLSPTRLAILAATVFAVAVPQLATATPRPGTCPNSNFTLYYSPGDSADLNGNNWVCGNVNPGHNGGITVDDHSRSHSSH